MGKYIRSNWTHYSTEDIESLVEEIYLAALNLPVPAHWQADSDTQWSFSTVADQLPVDLRYLTGAARKALVEKTGSERSLSEGGRSVPKAKEKGTWFISWKGQVMRVAHPDDVECLLGHTEALAGVGQARFLVPQALAQLLTLLLTRAGLTLRYALGSMKSLHSEVDLLRYVQEYLYGTEGLVRVLDEVQEKRYRHKTAESLHDLLRKYTTGGGKAGMAWKRWTVCTRVDRYFEEWFKAEMERRKLRAAGIEVEPAGESPAKMLRRLADEFDRREKKMKEEE